MTKRILNVLQPEQNNLQPERNLVVSVCAQASEAGSLRTGL